MIALMIATKNDVSPEYSKSTLIGLSVMVVFQLVAEMRFSCPTFCALQLGKADPRSLYARYSELRRLLRCNSPYVRKGAAEV